MCVAWICFSIFAAWNRYYVNDRKDGGAQDGCAPRLRLVERKGGGTYPARVSASTLRRFWGYVSEGVSASKFTKNALANFLGYADFEEFGLSQGTGERQSQMVIGKEISCDDLYEGQMLKLSWLPDRTCIIRYQGNGSFKVVSSENTRLAKDDTFECHHFINHEPAYLHAWKHGDDEPVTYVIGKKNGIIVEHYLED